MNRFLVCLLLASPALAQPTQEQIEPVGFRDFSGGLNDASDASNINRNESPDLGNVITDDPPASLSPRNGFLQCGTIPGGNKATGLFEYVKSNGTSRLIVTDGSSYYQTADCITFTTIATQLSTTALPTFTIVRDKLWATNQSTWTFTWDGTTQKYLDGTANTPSPAPPKCAYLEFWRERVWCARTSNLQSSLAFSALTDTAGNDIDPSTGTAAWPATNVIYVNREGGCPIYGIKAYRDNLYVFKGNCGIWRIIFNNDFDISVIKTLANVGTKFHNSIIELDGLLYFVGPDGIYSFDGDQTVRISDKIINRFASLRQPSTNEQFKTWDVKADYDAGTYSTTASADVTGSVTLSSTTLEDAFTDGNLTASPAWANTSGNWVITGASSEAINSVGSGLMATPISFSTGAFQFRARAYPSSGNNIEVKFVSSDNTLETGSGYALQLEHDSGNGVNVRLRRWSGGLPTQIGSKVNHATANGADNLNTYKVTRTTAGVFTVYEADVLLFTVTDTQIAVTSMAVVACNDGNCGFDNMYYWSYQNSGTWTSEQYNAVTVSSWSTYAANSTNNSGSVTYEVRVGSNTNGINGTSYSSIVPGNIISGTTVQTIIQTRVTLTGSVGDKSITPRLDDVTVNWSQGDITNNTIYGLNWKNRYYISAASGSVSNNNVVLVKSKSPSISWIPYDWQISAMTRYGSNFYATASTHSAIYRMDYGSNDNSVAIPWYWISRAESWEDWTRRKRLMEIQSDFRKNNAANAKISYSSDSGATWTDTTVDMSGSGRGTTKFFINDFGLDFRFRIYDSTLDEKATILGLTPWARKEARRL